MPFRTGPATPRSWFRPLARGAALCLLATLPAFAQSPPQPDPVATGRWLAFQESAAPWVETLATASRGERGRVRLAVAQARFARATGTPAGDAWLRRAADTARRGAFHPERVGALSVMSDEAYRRGDIAAVIAIENEALADARRYGDRRELGGSLYGLGMADMAEGRLDQAEARYREAIAIWREGAGLERQIVFAERALGRVLETRGQYAEAVEMQVNALETMLRIGRPIEQSESYYTLAKLFLNLEDHEAALEGTNQAIALMGDTPPDFPLGLNLILRAQAQLKLDDPAAALADAETAMAAFRRAGGDLGPALASLSLGRAQFALGRREEGLATLREGRALAARLNERVLDSDLALAEGEALVAMGRPADAIAPLEQAYAIGEDLKLDRLRQDVSLEMEKAYSAVGRTADALAASKRAYAFRTRLSRFDQLGQLAAGNGNARARFMALEPGQAGAPGGQDTLAASQTGLPAWIWALALPTLLLAWGLVRVLRHAHGLREEKRQIAARQMALETEHQALRERVALDPLTGALTRQAFAAELATLLRHAENHGRSVALLVFDLDNFKTINDQHGHLAGDEALRLATGIARGKLRSDDLLGRFGGDEFLVACEGLDQPAAEALAEQLRFDLVWRAPDATPPMPGLSLSVGVAVADLGKGYDAGDLFHRADTALFRAKRAGRNRVVGDDPAHAGDADSRRARQWNDALAEP